MFKNSQEQRIRVVKCFLKIKKFLIPQAKQIISYKEQQLQPANEIQNKNFETIPFSSRISRLFEKQCLNQEAEILFSASRNTFTTQMLDKQNQQGDKKVKELMGNNPLQRKKLPSIAHVSPVEKIKSED